MPFHVFITGGTGYLGANLLLRILKNGDKATLICRKSSSLDGIDGLAGNYDWRIATRIVRIEDPSEIVGLALKAAPDAFVHCAALGRYDTSFEQFGPLLDANIKLGTYVLEAMRQLADITGNSHPLVFCGTYWQSSGPDSANRPNSFYAATKCAFEEIARFYQATLALPVLGLRFYDIYGPGDWRKRIVSLIADATNATAPLAMSAGEQTLRFVHIEDAVSALLHALDILDLSPDRVGAPLSYGVYGDEAVTLKEFTERIEILIGTKANIAWGARPYRRFEIFNPFLIERLPGWSPDYSLDKGLAETVAWTQDTSERPNS